MRTNASGPSGMEKAPMGQCPLCYTDNSYSVSRCIECNLPLPWAKAESHEREPCGACLKCQSENPYTTLNCWSCGSRLPWANAVSAVVQRRAATGHVAMLAAPSANGHGAPAKASTQSVPFQAIPINPAPVYDEPNQIVDAVSFICPPLGFVSYVTLLGTLPRQALNAAKFALYGLCMWVFVLMVFVVGPVKFKFSHRSSAPAAPVTTVATNSDTAGDIYQ